MDLTEYITEAQAEWKATPMPSRPSGIPSSPHYDSKLITWHLLYHTGQAPKRISTGRGHTYNVETPGRKLTARISDYYDHRAGVSL